MSLSDLVTSDAAVFLSTDDFATTVTYRPPAGADEEVTAIVYDSMTEARNDNGIDTFVSTRNITYATAAVTIDMRGLIIIGSDEWSITRRIYSDDVLTSLELQRIELYEHARPGLRRT